LPSFAGPLQSIESYMRNLNSHPSYRQLRELRLQELEQQGYPSGITLSQGLQSYSERGQDYIDEIQQMIEFNQLQRFDVTSPGGDNHRDSDSASGEQSATSRTSFPSAPTCWPVKTRILSVQLVWTPEKTPAGHRQRLCHQRPDHAQRSQAEARPAPVAESGQP